VKFFEVDARFVTIASLHELFTDGRIDSSLVQLAFENLEIRVEMPNARIV
jgi:pyruvate dehydrogenase complex dehydrogenase (E1) component